MGKNGILHVPCGVPQGSVLRPTLWNAYDDKILERNVPVNVKLLAYADDLALIVCGNSARILSETGTESMRQVSLTKVRTCARENRGGFACGKNKY